MRLTAALLTAQVVLCLYAASHMARSDLPDLHVPALPYAYDALEPYIDEATMKVHSTKHHVTYATKATASLRGLINDASTSDDIKKAATTALSTGQVAPVLTLVDKLPFDDTPAGTLRKTLHNNGGGFINHNEFFAMLAPHKNPPADALVKAIGQWFGSLDAFKQQFTEKALGVFGSGWVFLTQHNKGGRMALETAANQDRPKSGDNILLALDVWEHAYYLKHQSARADYVAAWWNVVNWNEVARRAGIKTVDDAEL